MASRTNPGRSRVSIVEKVPSRACEAPVGRARVKHVADIGNGNHASHELSIRTLHV